MICYQVSLAEVKQTLYANVHLLTCQLFEMKQRDSMRRHHVHGLRQGQNF